MDTFITILIMLKHAKFLARHVKDVKFAFHGMEALFNHSGLSLRLYMDEEDRVFQISVSSEHVENINFDNIVAAASAAGLDIEQSLFSKDVYASIMVKVNDKLYHQECPCLIKMLSFLLESYKDFPCITEDATNIFLDDIHHEITIAEE